MNNLIQSKVQLNWHVFLKLFLVVISISSFLLLVGCQIHKPVPVEYVATGVNQSVRPTSSQPINARAPSNTRPPRNATQMSRYNPLPAPAAWTPIDIQPLQIEPTQPMTKYEFKPRPQPSAQVQREQYTQPVSVAARQSGHTHVVKRGENLFSIAKLYGLNISEIAALNNLSPPYAIFPNQNLKVRAGTGTTASTVVNQAQTQPITPPAASTAIQWAWPARGQILKGFQPGKSNGVEITGEAGSTIRASADGVVLYSGNEVTGYGELIIIDHGGGYMSTYAHNRRLLVAQGAQVKRGQKIAEMGSSEAERTKLHFEIRKSEKPVDPLAYLPNR